MDICLSEEVPALDWDRDWHVTRSRIQTTFVPLLRLITVIGCDYSDLSFLLVYDQSINIHTLVRC